MARFIVPPYLLHRLAETDDPRFGRASAAARFSLQEAADLREARRVAPLRPRSTLVAEPGGDEPAGPARSIGDAQGTERLPGALVRSEGQPSNGDVAVDEAYDGLGETYAFFAEVFGRRSIDDAELPLDATVHFGRDYDNAFWDGERMVFGDGDGEVFNRFTASLSVIGHELAHGVIQHAGDLVYQGQSGALNESIADVFGVLVEQYSRGQNAADASWLVGEGLFTAEVQGSALRSMSAPGTAYDDDVLGKDPQPGHMDDYVATSDDNGGVHINSGIPNRAFYLAATKLGGRAWETAGRIWYDTLASGRVSPTMDFSAFAVATVATAAEQYGDGSGEAAAVIEAWEGVGLVLG